MAPMVVERWEAKDGMGPYTTRYWPISVDGKQIWPGNLDMTSIPCPENDGIARVTDWDFLCACLPSNRAWTERDYKLLKLAGYKLKRYAVLSPYVREGFHQVVFDANNWLWKESIRSRSWTTFAH